MLTKNVPFYEWSKMLGCGSLATQKTLMDAMPTRGAYINHVNMAGGRGGGLPNVSFTT